MSLLNICCCVQASGQSNALRSFVLEDIQRVSGRYGHQVGTNGRGRIAMEARESVHVGHLGFAADDAVAVLIPQCIEPTLFTSDEDCASRINCRGAPWVRQCHGPYTRSTPLRTTLYLGSLIWSLLCRTFEDPQLLASLRIVCIDISGSPLHDLLADGLHHRQAVIPGHFPQGSHAIGWAWCLVAPEFLAV